MGASEMKGRGRLRVEPKRTTGVATHSRQSSAAQCANARGAARDSPRNPKTAKPQLNHDIRRNAQKPRLPRTGPALAHNFGTFGALPRALHLHTLQTQSFQSNSHVCILRYCLLVVVLITL